MRNIYVLPTNKPSRLIIYSTLLNEFRLLDKLYEDWKHKRHIYITNEEKIKEGDWQLSNDKHITVRTNSFHESDKKIILTTDQDLIKDGVQAIDDEFLKWFIKNQSCKKVKVNPMLSNNGRAFYGYKIIIPKKEVFKHEVRVLSKEEVLANRCSAYEFIDFNKQETPEEVAERFKEFCSWGCEKSFLEGYKLAQEISYSEKDMKEAFRVGFNVGYNDETSPSYLTFEQWFKKFKKK